MARLIRHAPHHGTVTRAEARVAAYLCARTRCSERGATLIRVADRRTYAAVVTRDGDWWMVRVPEIDGLTQVADLDGVEQAARELVAVTLDVPADSFDVNMAHP